MLKEKLVSIQWLQKSGRPRVALGGALCSALALGIATAWAVPASASSTRVNAPDGTYQGKPDTTGQCGNSSASDMPSR